MDNGKRGQSKRADFNAGQSARTIHLEHTGDQPANRHECEPNKGKENQPPIRLLLIFHKAAHYSIWKTRHLLREPFLGLASGLVRRGVVIASIENNLLIRRGTEVVGGIDGVGRTDPIARASHKSDRCLDA